MPSAPHESALQGDRKGMTNHQAQRSYLLFLIKDFHQGPKRFGRKMHYLFVATRSRRPAGRQADESVALHTDLK